MLYTNSTPQNAIAYPVWCHSCTIEMYSTHLTATSQKQKLSAIDPQLKYEHFLTYPSMSYCHKIIAH